jgi:hypothetical protein
MSPKKIEPLTYNNAIGIYFRYDQSIKSAEMRWEGQAAKMGK